MNAYNRCIHICLWYNNLIKSFIYAAIYLTDSQKSTAVKLESPGQMTREELERHLESKRHEFGIEKATASLPMEIFSNDPNQERYSS